MLELRLLTVVCLPGLRVTVVPVVVGNGVSRTSNTTTTAGLSWERPSSSSSIACSTNTSVGSNASGGLVTKSVPHAFLPAYQCLPNRVNDGCPAIREGERESDSSLIRLNSLNW